MIKKAVIPKASTQRVSEVTNLVACTISEPYIDPSFSEAPPCLT